MSSSRHPIREKLEWLAVRAGFAILPRLPRPWIVALSRGLGRLALMVSPKLRRIAEANLEVVFGTECPTEERNRILRRSYQSFALMLLDTFWFSRDTRERMETWVDLAPDVNGIYEAGPRVCLTLHLGNWEVLGMAFQARGLPLASVANPLKNPSVDRLFIRHREKLGQKIIPRKGAARGILKVLRDGEKIALVMDQNTAPNEGGAFVDFFGIPATTSIVPAALALKTRAPIFMTCCIADAEGRYHTTPPLYLDLPDDLGTGENAAVTLTQRLNHHMETVIRAHPEYWCWMYKRWKHRRKTMPANRFPFYTSVYHEPG
ncbi:MAG: lysophospholipid acyltransferase family protein [Verrucomicrobia bacterium]|nr:lysophospholipid acyltransferase family protein [Verrucomicrobiota bacterium]